MWAAAAAGVAAKLWQLRRIEWLSVALYLLLGWIGLIALDPLLASVEGCILFMLLAGGFVYSAGVIFHLSDRQRYRQALWHGCVLVAAAIHYFAILSIVES